MTSQYAHHNLSYLNNTLQPFNVLLDNTILDKNYHAWNEYTNLCFSLQGDIVAFEDKRNITEATGQSWRNIVSSTAFYTYKGTCVTFC